MEEVTSECDVFLYVFSFVIRLQSPLNSLRSNLCSFNDMQCFVGQELSRHHNQTKNTPQNCEPRNVPSQIVHNFPLKYLMSYIWIYKPICSMFIVIRAMKTIFLVCVMNLPVSGRVGVISSNDDNKLSGAYVRLGYSFLRLFS